MGAPAGGCKWPSCSGGTRSHDASTCVIYLENAPPTKFQMGPSFWCFRSDFLETVGETLRCSQYFLTTWRTREAGPVERQPSPSTREAGGWLPRASRSYNPRDRRFLLYIVLHRALRTFFNHLLRAIAMQHTRRRKRLPFPFSTLYYFIGLFVQSSILLGQQQCRHTSSVATSYVCILAPQSH